MTPLSITTTLTQIWQKAKSELRLILPNDIFESWFENLECAGGDDSKIVLSTPSPLAPIWITDNYLDIILQNISMAAGQKLTVDIVVLDTSDSIEVQQPIQTSERIAKPLINKEPKVLQSINPRNTFENFIVGDDNEFAHATALAVAQNVGRAVNPFFLYGSTGLGKTHLMHAIAHFVIKNNPQSNVVYISSECFVNDYIDSIAKKDTASFRKKFRNVDVLLIDDIQFLAGKLSCQTEFFHTFNDLFHANKQIILSCDKPINEVSDIEKRLVSRFEWGVCVNIKSPNYETRMAILRKKLATMGDSISINNDILDFIAKHFTKNVRRLEGALNKIIGYWSLISSSDSISLEKAQSLLADDILEDGDNQIDIEYIQKTVADYHKISVDDILGKRRTAAIALARQISMYLSRELTHNTLQEIGKRFGGRDHGTVMHANKVVSERIKQEDNIRREVEFLKKSISM